MRNLTLSPIGIFHSTKKYPYDAATQASKDIAVAPAWIEILPEFQNCLPELEKFSHVWVVFWFDRNDSWKPVLMPPRGHTHKVGLFATRSPYRPNPVGISALKIEKIESGKIFVGAHDILDQTPVIDIKPYLSSADSFPEARLGWISDETWSIQFTELAEQQLQYLEDLPNLRNFIVQQLSTNPFDFDRKRIEKIDEKKFVLSYRTWRIAVLQNEDLRFTIESIHSGYGASELADPSDPYTDKKLHLSYHSKYT
jgi:tRNA-Thr(GGU) m(6)t(6)A37 methyltransferase TsaA